jgi:hypothetical protein
VNILSGLENDLEVIPEDDPRAVADIGIHHGRDPRNMSDLDP